MIPVAGSGWKNGSVFRVLAAIQGHAGDLPAGSDSEASSPSYVNVINLHNLDLHRKS